MIQNPRRLRMHRGDRKPDLRIVCWDGDAPADLSGADQVRVIARLKGSVAVLIDAIVPGPADGVVVYEWAAADTTHAGVLEVEVEALFAGRPQTFRYADGSPIEVEILPDIA